MKRKKKMKKKKMKKKKMTKKKKKYKQKIKNQLLNVVMQANVLHMDKEFVILLVLIKLG